MLLPNKLFSYQATALPLLPEIMQQLHEPLSPNELVKQLGHLANNPIKLIDALDCLYALGRITLDNEGMLRRC